MKVVLRFTLNCILFILLLCIIAYYGSSEESDLKQNDEYRITIKNNEFTVNGKRIWINGANTPWNKWNDFGGAYNDTWWDSHFAKLHEA